MFANGLKVPAARLLQLTNYVLFTLDILHKCVDFEALPPRADGRRFQSRLTTSLPLTRQAFVCRRHRRWRVPRRLPMF